MVNDGLGINQESMSTRNEESVKWKFRFASRGK